MDRMHTDPEGRVLRELTRRARLGRLRIEGWGRKSCNPKMRREGGSVSAAVRIANRRIGQNENLRYSVGNDSNTSTLGAVAADGGAGVRCAGGLSDDSTGVCGGSAAAAAGGREGD